MAVDSEWGGGPYPGGPYWDNVTKACGLGMIGWCFHDNWTFWHDRKYSAPFITFCSHIQFVTIDNTMYWMIIQLERRLASL
jgi:hypothetical protein